MKKTILVILIIVVCLSAAVVPALAQEIPEERQLPRLIDWGSLLSESEEETLLSQLDEISERQQCDVVVVTVYTLSGKTPRAYADDFFDYNGYGMGESDSGILLLVSMEDRDWYVSTHSFGTSAVTNAGLDYMSKQFLPALSAGNYAEAFKRYGEACDELITRAKAGRPLQPGDIRDPLPWYFIAIAIGLGLIPALISVNVMKRKLKSIRKQENATEYVRAGSLQMTDRSEIYLYHTVSKRARPQDDDSSSSSGSGRSYGSSTHTSSSGRSHGGGGGKF